MAMMGSTTVQERVGRGSKGAAVAILGKEKSCQDSATTSVRDRICDDLQKILDELDAFDLWLAAIHVSSAIEAVQKESLVSQIPAQ